MTLTDRLRNIFCNILNAIGVSLLKLGIKADFITLLGIVGNVFAACCIINGNLVLGGVFVVLTGPLDAIDGTLARLQGNSRPFGALLDSVSDRISEAAVLFGLLNYFFTRGNQLGVILAFFSLVGSFLVSYVRARAQSLGSDPKIGILTRVERYIITSLFLLFSQPIVGLGILSVFTHITVFQRIWYAWKELH